MLRKLLVGGFVVVVVVAGALLYVWTHVRLPVVLAVPEPGVVLDGVTVINPAESREPAKRIVVEGDRIARIDDSDAGSGSYTGSFVLPGLTDMHVHLPLNMRLRQAELFAFLFLAHGVTSVRDTGSLDGATFEYRRRAREGEFASPRIFVCGPFVDGEPPLWPNSEVVRTPDEGRAVVEKLAALGVDCIKAYNQLTPETLAAIREAAHAKGLLVIGHVPARIRYEDALLDDAQHLIGAAGRPPEGAKALNETLSTWRTIGEDQYRSIVDTVAANDLANTPTLVTLDRLALAQDYEAARNDEAAALLPRYFRDVLWNPQIGLPFLRRMQAADYAAIRETRAPRMRMVRELYEAGTRLHLGTDVQIPFVVPGVSVHQEMKLLTEAGIPLEQVWAIGTRGAAKGLGVPGLGEVRPGAPADLLVFRDDPTSDLAALSTLQAVVAQGRLYTREQLDTGMQRYREHFADPLFDTVSMRLTEMAMQRMFNQ